MDSKRMRELAYELEIRRGTAGGRLLVEAATVLLTIANALGGLTAEDVVAMRERERKATKGPWRYWEHHNVNFDGEHMHGVSVTHEQAEWNYNATHFHRSEDSLFTAHSRTDIPRLLAVVERLMGVK